MQISGRKHISGERLTELVIEAESYAEERMLTALLASIRSGGRVEIIQGRGKRDADDTQDDDEPDGGYSDLYDEEAQVFTFSAEGHNSGR